ncbi:MAG TPA: glutathione S-transferase [Stellaceae bacterium]|nr:glutathione S-transferase [Stellaceae bacterium]
MKLRYAPTSPYVRKVMVTATETGLSDRIEKVPSSVMPTKPNEEVAKENPLVKIPALVTDDGLVLYDSPVICEYLDSLHEGQKLFPAAGKARWVALRQQALGDGIMEAAILARYESVRPKEFCWADWIEAQLRKVRGAIASLESEAENGTLRGPLTIGLVTIGCALGYLDFRFADLQWRQQAPALGRWYGDFAERPSMKQTAPADPK